MVERNLSVDHVTIWPWVLRVHYRPAVNVGPPEGSSSWKIYRQTAKELARGVVGFYLL
jgi:hypothetical protein